MTEGVREYRLKPEGFAVTRRQIVIYWVSLTIFLVASLLTVFPWPANLKALKRDPTLPLGIVAALLIVGHELKKRIREKKKRWNGHVFSIDDIGCISCRCEGLPTISIAPNEVTRIVEVPGDGANVIAGEVRLLSIPLAVRSIPVPKSLEDYDEFLGRLRHLKSTDVQSPSLFLRLCSITLAPFLFLCVYFAFAFQDHRLNLVASAVILGLLIFVIAARRLISSHTGKSEISIPLACSPVLIILYGAFHLYRLLAG